MNNGDTFGARPNCPMSARSCSCARPHQTGMLFSAPNSQRAPRDDRGRGAYIEVSATPSFPFLQYHLFRQTPRGAMPSATSIRTSRSWRRLRMAFSSQLDCARHAHAGFPVMSDMRLARTRATVLFPNGFLIGTVHASNPANSQALEQKQFNVNAGQKAPSVREEGTTQAAEVIYAGLGRHRGSNG